MNKLTFIIPILLLLNAISAHSEQMHNLDVLIEVKEASGFLPAIVQQNVNVRISPNKKSKKIGLIRGGVTIRAEFLLGSEWAKVSFNSEDAFIHKSALIKQQYKADMNYSIKNKESSVFSMSGWHYSHLPGSYFLNYQSNKYGQASFGPIGGSSYESIHTKLFKIKSSDSNAYLATTHVSGNRTYYTSYLAIPEKEQLIVVQLPTHTSTDEMNYNVKDNHVIFTGKAFSSCCEYRYFELMINLKDLTYSGNIYDYKIKTNKELKRSAPKPIELIVSKIKLNRFSGV